jgi:hypothetical protein
VFALLIRELQENAFTLRIFKSLTVALEKAMGRPLTANPYFKSLRSIDTTA